MAGIRKKIFTNIEEYAGMADQLVRDLAFEEAFQDEIKYTLEHNNQSYIDWRALSYKGKNINKVKLTDTYDIGWQNRSPGRRYKSSRGHAIIIVRRRKGLIVMVLYSKACQKCDAAENRGG